jgi:YcaO-like protein with predicted kinase domain
MPSRYYDIGGTIRSCSADETINFLQPFWSRLGITRVANITGLDSIGITAAICIRPNAKHLSVSQGKGITWEHAMISSVMESIETYHAENPPSPFCYGSYAELSQSFSIISPQEFNQGFFENTHSESVQLPWVQAKDLFTYKNVLIPHALINLDSTSLHPEYGFLQVSTNGLASGNTHEEAICHGLYEVIERDCLYRWAHFSEMERNIRRLNLSSVDSPINKNLIDKYLAANIQIKVWNITSSVGVPTFHCVIFDPNPFRGQGIFRGTGTHLSKHIALARALMEAAQSRLGIISGSRDDIFNDQYQLRLNYPQPKQIDVEESSYLSIQSPIGFPSFVENIKQILHLLSLQGFKQVCLINHTKSDFGIPVVHVFIPGMRFNGARI